MLVEEGSEALLELARGDRLADVSELLERALEGLGAPAVGVARDEGIDRKRAREAADLRFVERVRELLRREDSGEVDESAGGLVTGIPARP